MGGIFCLANNSFPISREIVLVISVFTIKCILKIAKVLPQENHLSEPWGVIWVRLPLSPLVLWHILAKIIIISMGSGGYGERETETEL